MCVCIYVYYINIITQPWVRTFLKGIPGPLPSSFVTTMHDRGFGHEVGGIIPHSLLIYSSGSECLKLVHILRHYQHYICAALLTVKAGEFPELRIKAYAGRVLLAYLQSVVADLVNSYSLAAVPEDLLLVHGVLSEICRWFILVEQAGRYLSKQQADEIWACSMK